MPVNQTHKSPQWLAQMEEFFKACADQTRLRILNMLASEGEVCVCHLVDVLQTNQPKVSRHLAYLKRVGLVADRKDGLWVHYRLAVPLAEHTERLLTCLKDCCVEVSEMRQDVMNLQAVRESQPLMKLSHRQPMEPMLMAKQPDAATVREPEIQIELL
jgi:ArsR family transcriptional regulator, arsenate/arsenite/antimonite-responsive transcriptional repressor